MAEKMTVFEAQKRAFSFAGSHGMDQSVVDMLLCGQMNWDTTRMLMHYRDEFSEGDFALLMASLEKCAQGMPPQYVLGHSSFFGRDFVVNGNTLIPRVETEDLVEWILQDNDERSTVFADIGTGSGAIGLTLAAERPSWHGVLGDISAGALDVAWENAGKLGVSCDFRLSDVFDRIDGLFDVIVSNPPYIAESEKSYMDRSVLEHEPETALFAADNGLAVYRKICRQAGDHIRGGGSLYLEIGFLQGQAVCGMFREAYPDAEVTLRKDESGHDRMIRVRFKA